MSKQSYLTYYYVHHFLEDSNYRDSLGEYDKRRHDRHMHGMETVYNATGGKVIVDLAFKVSDQDYLIRSSKNDPENAQALLVSRDATSARQLSEWGMRMIQGQFPRIKDPLIYEEKGERKIIVHLLVHLYNFQTSQVGINTILNSYMQKGNNVFFGRAPLPATANDML